MPIITVCNPSEGLLSMCRIVRTLWVQTCHNDTCGCVSHEPGYELVTLETGDAVAASLFVVGHNVHCHGTTETRCTEIGAARYAVKRGVDNAYAALQLLKTAKAKTFAEALAIANVHAAQTAKFERAQKRSAFTAELISAGWTADEASYLYGAGSWTQEANWQSVAQKRRGTPRKTWLRLIQSAQAENTRVGLAARMHALGLSTLASFPRMYAWVKYLAILEGVASPDDYPSFGQGWQLLPAK